MKSVGVALLLFVVISLFGVNGYPYIAPRVACWSMRPSHGYSPQTLSSSPFTVNAPSTYTPNQEIEVSISGSRRFRGFLLQARDQNGNTVGTFRASDSKTQVYCDNGALTHNSAQNKNRVSGFWRAPSTAVGPIVFKATVVQSYSTYWVGVTSSQVTSSN